MSEREDVRAVIRQACAPWLWREADVGPLVDAVLREIAAAGYVLGRMPDKHIWQSYDGTIHVDDLDPLPGVGGE